MDTGKPSIEIQILQLNREIASLRHAVCVLISWIGASAGSPLSAAECRTLVTMAEGKDRYE